MSGVYFTIQHMENTDKVKKTDITTKEVLLVDKDDNFIGVAEKIHAHRKSLLHRAFSVFIFNDKNELLLQKRSIKKYHCGGLWTNSCCSHAQLNEDITKTAQKRLEFEMGISTSLTYVEKFTYLAKLNEEMTEHEIDYVFVGWVSDKSSFSINQEEACDFSWAGIKNLQESITKKPEKYTPWLKKSLQVALTHQHFQQK